MPRQRKLGFLLLLSIIPRIIASNSTITPASTYLDLEKFNLTYIGGFSRKDCFQRTSSYINSSRLDKDSEVFFRDDGGRVRSEGEDIVLTLRGCKALCGANYGWYKDAGPRISTWMIPILILLSNVELSPLDKRRFFAIIHLIGDPIDSIWSLVHKIDAWNQCWQIAAQYAARYNRDQRVIATVFAGFEEILGEELRRADFQTIVDHGNLGTNIDYIKWRLAALKLADSRSDEILRTTLAIILYVYSVIASFVEEVGGDQTSPPGGRIGTALFISWLVPVVLLSNSIGGFTSRRSAYSILLRFADQTNLQIDFTSQVSVHLLGRKPLTTDYFESLAWSGGIYTFRNWKATSPRLDDRPWMTIVIFCAAIAPICIAMTGSFIIIWNTAPVGFTCRHFWVIGIFVSYFLSAFITYVSRWGPFATGVFHWHFVLWKDAIIGIGSLLTIFLSCSGALNSCTCFSGKLSFFSQPHVALNVDSFYTQMNDTTYPAVVSICLFLQLSSFLVMGWMWWHGLEVMRWSEKARFDTWKALGGAKRLTLRQSYVSRIH